MKNILFIFLILLIFTAYGYGPQQAVSYRSQEYKILADKVNAQEYKLNAMKLGLDGTLKVNRASQQTQTGYTLSVSYQFKPENITDAESALVNAKNELEAEERACIMKGMNLYADHLIAMAQMKSAILQLEIAKVNWDEASRKNKIGALAAIDLEQAQLDLDDAEVAKYAAGNDLHDIAIKAVNYNFTGDPEFVFPRYIPIVIDVAKTPEMKSLIASAMALRGRLRAANRESQIGLSLDFSKSGGDVQVMTSLSSRTRSANFTFGYPSLYDPSMLLFGSGWRTSVNLEIPLSPSAESGVKVAKVEYNNIIAQKKRRETELMQEMIASKSQVANEEYRLSIARKRCDIATKRVGIANIKLESGAVSLFEKLKNEKEKAEMDVALATAWKRYVTSIGNHMDIIGGNWNIMENVNARQN